MGDEIIIFYIKNIISTNIDNFNLGIITGIISSTFISIVIAYINNFYLSINDSYPIVNGLYAIREQINFYKKYERDISYEKMIKDLSIELEKLITKIYDLNAYNINKNKSLREFLSSCKIDIVSVERKCKLAREDKRQINHIKNDIENLIILYEVYKKNMNKELFIYIIKQRFVWVFIAFILFCLIIG